MKNKLKITSLAKNQQQSEKDNLQVKGNVNLSVGVQIFGIKNQSKKQKIFYFLLLTLLILLILTIAMATSNQDLANKLASVIEKLLAMLQVFVSSRDVITGIFKNKSTQDL